MKEDIRILLVFMYNFNGLIILSDLPWTPDKQLELFSHAADAKELGCGHTFREAGFILSGQIFGIIKPREISIF
jgi:hypothetical protein